MSNFNVPQIKAPSTPSPKKVVQETKNTLKSSLPSIQAPNASIGSNIGKSVAVAAISSIGAPKALPIKKLPDFKLPAVPKFPGMGKAGILLGAGPKFISGTISKFTSIVPPFAPGLTISAGAIGAISAVVAASKQNPGDFLKQLTANISSEVTNEISNQINLPDVPTTDSVIAQLEQSSTNQVQSAVDSVTDTTSNNPENGQPTG